MSNAQGVNVEGITDRLNQIREEMEQFVEANFRYAEAPVIRHGDPDPGTESFVRMFPQIINVDAYLMPGRRSYNGVYTFQIWTKHTSGEQEAFRIAALLTEVIAWTEVFETGFFKTQSASIVNGGFDGGWYLQNINLNFTYD